MCVRLVERIADPAARSSSRLIERARRVNCMADSQIAEYHPSNTRYDYHKLRARVHSCTKREKNKVKFLVVLIST